MRAVILQMRLSYIRQWSSLRSSPASATPSLPLPWAHSAPSRPYQQLSSRVDGTGRRSTTERYNSKCSSSRVRGHLYRQLQPPVETRSDLEDHCSSTTLRSILIVVLSAEQYTELITLWLVTAVSSLYNPLLQQLPLAAIFSRLFQISTFSSFTGIASIFGSLEKCNLTFQQPPTTPARFASSAELAILIGRSSDHHWKHLSFSSDEQSSLWQCSCSKSNQIEARAVRHLHRPTRPVSPLEAHPPSPPLPQRSSCLTRNMKYPPSSTICWLTLLWASLWIVHQIWWSMRLHTLTGSSKSAAIQWPPITVHLATTAMMKRMIMILLRAT